MSIAFIMSSNEERFSFPFSSSSDAPSIFRLIVFHLCSFIDFWWARVDSNHRCFCVSVLQTDAFATQTTDPIANKYTTLFKFVKKNCQGSRSMTPCLARSNGPLANHTFVWVFLPTDAIHGSTASPKPRGHTNVCLAIYMILFLRNFLSKSFCGLASLGFDLFKKGVSRIKRSTTQSLQRLYHVV